jgi:phage shock protein PspC (stress-responsive transcriptional regulator)
MIVSKLDVADHDAGDKQQRLTDESTMTPALYRSSRGAIWGVCRGIAEHAGLDVGLVRSAVVLGLFFVTAPVLLGYLVLALALPVRTPDASVTDLQWASDSVTLDYRASLVPHVIPWLWWLAMWGAVVAALISAGIGVVALDVVFAEPRYPVTQWPALVAVGLMMLSALAPFGLLTGLVHRTFALTCTHDAVWLTRGNLREPQRLLFTEVESIRIENKLWFFMRDGSIVQMPLPAESEAFTAWLDEARQSTKRALTHEADLHEAGAARSDLEQMLQRAGPLHEV